VHREILERECDKMLADDLRQSFEIGCDRREIRRFGSIRGEFNMGEVLLDLGGGVERF
jgi:hypothetical protein